MIDVLRDLFRHMAWADSTLAHAIAQNDAARQDQELRTLFHHILFTHRFFALTCQGLSVSEQEFRVPADFDALLSRCRETHETTDSWLRRLTDADLDRTFEVAFFQGRTIPFRDALLQVVLHSQGHRSQCATRLRLLGGKAPMLDYILWTKDRPAS